MAYEEATRAILEQQSAVDGAGLPSKDPELFLDLMLEHCVRCLAKAALVPQQMAFFDRGIPDVAAYAVRFSVDPERFYRTANEQLFNRNIFVLAPWKKIFETDEFRGKSFDEYKEFHGVIVQAYAHAGCRLIEVPFASVSARAEYVVKKARELGRS